MSEKLNDKDYSLLIVTTVNTTQQKVNIEFIMWETKLKVVKLTLPVSNTGTFRVLKVGDDYLIVHLLNVW